MSSNRDNGNAAAMRAELNELDIDAHRMRWDRKFRDLREAENFVERVIDTIRRALAAPARNCDVGTEEEQTERFIEFCKGHLCYQCPIQLSKRCGIGWALMPFAPEKGGSK